LIIILRNNKALEGGIVIVNESPPAKITPSGTENSSSSINNNTATTTKIGSHSSFSDTASTTTVPPLRRSAISDDWIRKCATHVSSELVVPFEIADGFRGYRLGDCVRRCVGCPANRGLPCLANEYQYRECRRTGTAVANDNGTAASAMIAEHRPTTGPCRSTADCVPLAGLGGNLTYLLELLEGRRSNPAFKKPNDDVLVIHLRLGDIIERSKATPAEMLLRGADPVHSVNMKERYANGIRSVSEYLDNIEESGLRKVSIVGGSHRPDAYKKSRVYAVCLKRAIEKAMGPSTQVEMQLDGSDPDRDFYYVVHAKRLVISAGGYSGMMGRVAKLLGGELVGRTFGT
jgi:hypothetical protein